MDLDEYRAKFNAKGEELMDSTPVASTLRFKPKSEYQRIREIIMHELSTKAAEAELETFEEANDFDVGDDFDPTTPYEEQFDPDTGVSNFDFQEEIPIDQKKPKGKKTPDEESDKSDDSAGGDKPGSGASE